MDKKKKDPVPSSPSTVTQLPGPILEAKDGVPVVFSFESLPKLGNPFQPLIWVDAIQTLVRGDAGGVTLRLFSLLPEAAIEVGRLQMAENTLKMTMDILAKTLNYYPSPSTDSQQPSAEK